MLDYVDQIGPSDGRQAMRNQDNGQLAFARVMPRMMSAQQHYRGFVNAIPSHTSISKALSSGHRFDPW